MPIATWMPPGPVVQIEEDQLAGPAEEHDPARRADLRPVEFGRLAGLGRPARRRFRSRGRGSCRWPYDYRSGAPRGRCPVGVSFPVFRGVRLPRPARPSATRLDCHDCLVCFASVHSWCKTRSGGGFGKPALASPVTHYVRWEKGIVLELAQRSMSFCRATDANGCAPQRLSPP